LNTDKAFENRVLRRAFALKEGENARWLYKIA
jgi:hypothetical protein